MPKLRKMAQHGPKTHPKGPGSKGRRSPRCPVWPPKHPFISPLTILFNHAGGGTPAHCDASRISAGVQFISSAAAWPNEAKHFQSLPITCSKRPQILQNSSPNPPKTVPKATQNPSKRPLGAHLGPMLSKNTIWNVQKTAKMRPKVAKRRSRASQPPPKLSPRLSKIRFSSNVFACFFGGVQNQAFLQHWSKMSSKRPFA